MISQNPSVDELIDEATHAIPTFLDDLVRCAHPQPHVALRIFVETFVEAVLIASRTSVQSPGILSPGPLAKPHGNPYPPAA